MRRGRLAIAALPSVGAGLLPPLLERFTAEHPDVDLEILDALSEGVLHAVEMGEADIGFAAGTPSARSRLSFHALLDDEFVALGTPDGPLAEDRAYAWEETMAMPFVAMAVGTSVRELVDAACTRVGRPPRAALRSLPPRDRRRARLPGARRHGAAGADVADAARRTAGAATARGLRGGAADRARVALQAHVVAGGAGVPGAGARGDAGDPCAVARASGTAIVNAPLKAPPRSTPPPPAAARAPPAPARPPPAPGPPADRSTGRSPPSPSPRAAARRA